MAEPRKTPEPDIPALVKNTEALVRMDAAIEGLSRNVSEHRGEERTQWNTILAKLDNCDRSMQELRYSVEQQQIQLIRQLEEERKDRRKAISDGQEAIGQSGHDAHALVKQLIDEELNTRKALREDRKEGRNLVVGAAKAVWDKGGQWVVLAVCLYLVLTIRSCSGTGFDLSKILGGG